MALRPFFHISVDMYWYIYMYMSMYIRLVDVHNMYMYIIHVHARTFEAIDCVGGVAEGFSGGGL